MDMVAKKRCGIDFYPDESKTWEDFLVRDGELWNRAKEIAHIIYETASASDDEIMKIGIPM